MARKNPTSRKICTCRHHVSIHTYKDRDRQAPGKCGVPGCPCQEFVCLVLHNYKKWGAEWNLPKLQQEEKK